MSTTNSEPHSSVEITPSLTKLPVTNSAESTDVLPSPTQDDQSIVLRCPEDANVPFEDLEVSKNTALIVQREDATSSASWSLISSDGSIEDVTTGYGADYFQEILSPDHSRIAFSELDIESGEFKVMISSIKGNDISEIYSAYDLVFELEWPSPDRLVLLELELDSWWSTTNSLINLSTNQREDLAQIYLDFGLYAFSPDATKLIYLSGFSGDRHWNLHDLTTGEDQIILEWFDANRIQLPYQAAVYWVGQDAVIAIMDENTLEWVRFDPGGFSSSSVSPSIIVFEQPSTSWGFNYWSNGRLLPVIRIYGEYLTDISGTREFYIADLSTGTLIDYCLDEHLLPTFIKGSIDDRFLAWEITLEEEEGIMVLDTQAGFWSWLPKYKLIGWGENE